jgi:hypothetical protein
MSKCVCGEKERGSERARDERCPSEPICATGVWLKSALIKLCVLGVFHDIKYSIASPLLRLKIALVGCAIPVVCVFHPARLRILVCLSCDADS